MPVYEYICNVCQQRKSLFVKGFGAPLSPACPACGSLEVRRLMSTFAYHKSLSDVWEESGEPDRPGPSYYKDPRNIGRWAEKRLRELGEETPPQVQQMIEAAREGEMPASLQDLKPGVGEV